MNEGRPGEVRSALTNDQAYALVAMVSIVVAVVAAIAVLCCELHSTLELGEPLLDVVRLVAVQPIAHGMMKLAFEMPGLVAISVARSELASAGH